MRERQPKAAEEVLMAGDKPRNIRARVWVRLQWDACRKPVLRPSTPGLRSSTHTCSAAAMIDAYPRGELHRGR